MELENVAQDDTTGRAAAMARVKAHAPLLQEAQSVHDRDAAAATLLQRARQQVRDRIEEGEKQLAKKTETIQQQSNQIRQLQTKVAQQGQKLKKAQQQRNPPAKLRKENESLQDEIASLKGQLNLARGGQRALRDQNRDLRRQIKNLRAAQDETDVLRTLPPIPNYDPVERAQATARAHGLDTLKKAKRKK